MPVKVSYGKYRDSDSRAPKGRKIKADALRIPMRVSDQLKDMLDAEREKGERYNDTIIRLLVNRTNRIATLQKKVDALEGELAMIKREQVLKHV